MKKINKTIEKMKRNLKIKMGIDFSKPRSLNLDFIRSEMRELEIILNTTGKDIKLKDIKKSKDGTLTYKGKNVILYIRDQNVPSISTYKFHIAWCEHLQEMEDSRRLSRYVVSTRRDGLFVVNEIDRYTNLLIKENIEKKMEVCVKCLDRLKYNGFKFDRRTFKSYVEKFMLYEFFDKYENNLKKTTLDLSQAKIAVLNDYPENWSDISRAYRKSKNWVCEECGINLQNNQEKLETHHIDRNKANVKLNNLKALCKNCHEKVHENDY